MTVQDPRIQEEIEQLQDMSDFNPVNMLNRLEAVWKYIASQERRIRALENAISAMTQNEIEQKRDWTFNPDTKQFED